MDKSLVKIDFQSLKEKLAVHQGLLANMFSQIDDMLRMVDRLEKECTRQEIEDEKD
jgi:hypothetical protein